MAKATEVKKKKPTTKKKPAPKKKIGSKGKYHKWITPEGLALVPGWKRNGLTDEQIAKNIGIQRTTMYDWAKRFPNFSDALKNGREVADIQVENALHKNATGFHYTEEQAIKVKKIYYEDGKRFEEEKIEIVEVKRYRQPETTAQIFWLKNRKSESWRNDDRVIEPEDQEAINMHRTTIAALKNRKVAAFDDLDDNEVNADGS